jgi:hypothetical protein
MGIFNNHGELLYKAGNTRPGGLLLYQQGGRINKTLANSSGLNFVQRMLEQNPKQIYVDPSGEPSTHLMESGEIGDPNNPRYIAYPTVVEKDGELVHLNEDKWDAQKYAIESGEYIEFKNKRQSKKFAEGKWKKPAQKYKEQKGSLYRKTR